MKVNQRDIVELNFELPNGKLKAHPALVVSFAAMSSCQANVSKRRDVALVFDYIIHLANE